MGAAIARRDPRHRPHPPAANGEGETTVAYGPPEVVADKLESYLVDGGIDGFVLSTPLNLAEAENLVDTLVPELQRRALHRTAYTGATLREHLGLPTTLVATRGRDEEPHAHTTHRGRGMNGIAR